MVCKLLFCCQLGDYMLLSYHLLRESGNSIDDFDESYTPWSWQFAPKNLLFQWSIFRGYVSFREWLRGDSSRDLLIPKRWRSRFALERVTLSPSQKGHKELPGRLWLLANTYKVIPRKAFWASWKTMSVFQLFVMWVILVISVIFWISLEISSNSTNVQPGWRQDQGNTPAPGGLRSMKKPSWTNQAMQKPPALHHWIDATYKTTKVATGVLSHRTGWQVNVIDEIFIRTP